MTQRRVLIRKCAVLRLRITMCADSEALVDADSDADVLADSEALVLIQRRFIRCAC